MTGGAPDLSIGPTKRKSVTLAEANVHGNWGVKGTVGCRKTRGSVDRRTEQKGVCGFIPLEIETPIWVGKKRGTVQDASYLGQDRLAVGQVL